jgi:hypothetical protein
MMGQKTEGGRRIDPRLWWLSAFLVALSWVIIFGYFVEIEDVSEAWHHALLLPGPMLAAVLLGFGARVDLNEIRERWVPSPPKAKAKPVKETPAPAEAQAIPLQAPSKATAPPPPAVVATPSPPKAEPSDAPGALPQVYLGPNADPSFAQWRLFWETPDGQRGVIILPTGPSIAVGRHEEADIVVTLPRVSRKHVEFEVQGAEVRVRDLGSSYGSWTRAHDGQWSKLAQSHVMSHGSQLRIADPEAIIFTLDPIPRQ